MDGTRYRKEGSLSEYNKRRITICDGIFDIGRRGTDATIPRVPNQGVTSIIIRGEGNQRHVNSINNYILRGIYDDAKNICKPTLCTLFLVLTIVQASLNNY